MFILKKDIKPGMVVWGEKNEYYDDPNHDVYGRRCMYTVTMINEDYFLGCPLTTQSNVRNCTLLSSKYYPIKKDSRIRETLYKVDYDDIVNSKSFNIYPTTFEYFKRNLYKRIIINQSDTPFELREMFVEEYLKDHVPKMGDILVYTSENKTFKYYYIYGCDEEMYNCVELDLNRSNNAFEYTIKGQGLVNIPKSIRFFDYYSEHSFDENELEDGLKSKILLKK